MKFTDDAWTLYQQQFPHVTAADRPRLEQEMTEDHTRFLTEAQGDEQLALGLKMLAIAKDLSRDLSGLSEKFILHVLIQKNPNGKFAQKAVERARTYLAQKGHTR